MEYICIGRIVNTHGIRGELRIESYSDFDKERYKKGNTVYIENEGEYLPFEVASFRVHKGFSLVSFAGYQDINLVEQYKTHEVYIRSEDRKPLPKGQYYRSELIGLMCTDEDGKQIGEVIAVEETVNAQNNLRVVRENGKETLIPYVPAFIKKVDPEQGTITVHVIEGLL